MKYMNISGQLAFIPIFPVFPSLFFEALGMSLSFSPLKCQVDRAPGRAFMKSMERKARGTRPTDPAGQRASNGRVNEPLFFAGVGPGRVLKMTQDT